MPEFFDMAAKQLKEAMPNEDKLCISADDVKEMLRELQREKNIDVQINYKEQSATCAVVEQHARNVEELRQMLLDKIVLFSTSRDYTSVFIPQKQLLKQLEERNTQLIEESRKKFDEDLKQK